MTIFHPEIKRLIACWQDRLRDLTDNPTLVLTCHTSPPCKIEFGILSKIVCDVTEVPIEQIRKKNRKVEIVLARQLLAYYCTEYTDMPLKKIGLYIGGKEHTSVIHSRRRIQDMIDTGDKLICDTMVKINKQIEKYRTQAAPEEASA